MSLKGEKISPIRPEEIAEIKLNTIPGKIIQVVNVLISENYSNGRATVMQKDIVQRLKDLGFDMNEVYKKGWLDFEPIFRKAGWKVSYDKPGFNESYEPSFEFVARNKKADK